MFVRSSVTECESLVARDLDESVICTVLGKSVSASKRRAADESSDGSGEDIFIPSDSHTQEPAAGDLFHVAMKLRRDIEHACKHLPSVPEISQCTPTKSMTWIPDSVFNFLMWTIVGPQACNAGESSLGDRMDAADDRARSKVMAIAQDIVFAVSHGRVVPPKQLALSMATRHLTRSARLVSMLNRFGHGVSDSKLHEIETGIAERTLAEDIPLPSNIKAGNGTVFFCWDNNDLVEETLTGMGTTHCTNGIVIQHPTASNVPDTAQPQLVPAVGSSKKKRPARSLSVVQQEFPQYIIGTRPEPHTVTTTANTPTRSREWLSGEDFLWFLLRSAESTSRFGRPSDEPQTIPVWSKFNADLYCQNKPGQPSNIGYLPVIPAPPTEHSTILEVLRRSVALTRRLDQQHCIITGDQAIYAKALEVLSKHKDEFSEVVLRLGAFHTACAFMVVLGKRFGGAGLGDLLTEAGVVGPNACKQVLAGKHYNRAIRCHKLVFEAMLQQNWELFEEHLEDDYSPHVDEAASDLLGQLDAMRETGNFAEGLQCVQTSAFKSLKERFTTFNDNLKKTSPMACFWLSYMEMVSLLLDFIRASRNGDWVLHLTAFRQMLKWFFAYDHVNYARYGSYYVNDMECLPESHESAQESLVSGDFCVSRSRNSFARVPVDQAIEQPINRDSKGRGGIVGFSKKPGAVHRWILTTHERASLTSACSKLAGPMLHTTQVTKERTAQVKRDEQDLVSLSELLYSWGNPFIGDKLVSLSSRTVCSEKAHDDLLNAGSIGEADVSKFIQERLVQKTASFYDKIPAHSLSTFSTSGQKKKKKSSKLQALKNERQLFTTLVILAKHRSIDIKHLVEFELGPLPWSIATADGCPVSTPKSKLLSDLEKDVAPLETVPQGTAVLIDAMAVLQSYTSVPGTFGDLSKLVFRQLISNFTRFGSKRVDFVSDCYHQLSIKSSERVKRASTNQPLRMLVQRPDQETPKQWKRYLSDPQNKMELIKFFADHWASTTEFATLLGTNRHVYVTVGQRCWLLKVADASNTVVNREDVPQLAAPHEEADCRLLLHAAHCFQHQEEAVAISSPDTDVAVLAIGLCASLQQQVRKATDLALQFVGQYPNTKAK
ncbi:uncharacterized protein LOC135816571 [Sycon ciliatum]|uniref:uncharacterized protein LOC135816571 n=1 Tax=Sycon ciliatum TaxID=27933 RepID=UPI0031F5FF79